MKVFYFDYPRYLEPIPQNKEGSIAIIYGTTELHLASDYHSFTKELKSVVDDESGCLPFANIAK